MAKKGKITKPIGFEEGTRKAKSRKYAQYFLIVCEDEKSEPAYFQHFQTAFEQAYGKAGTLYLEIKGTGKDPLGVVNAAIEARQKLKDKTLRDIDFTWVVFDRDDAQLQPTTASNFAKALQLAKKEKIYVACSNEVFELWLLLHLRQVEPTKPFPRKEIYAALQQAIRDSSAQEQSYEYDHYRNAAKIIPKILDYGNESKAIERAEALRIYHQGTDIIAADPSTDVYLLVKELRQWLHFYTYDD